MNRRYIFGIVSLFLLCVEILIGLYAHGWVRNYIGDLLVVILLYTLIRTISPYSPSKWYILPTIVLVFSVCVEFIQLWGFCDRFGITNRFLRILIGTGFSVVDLVSYTIGVIPCYVIDFINCKYGQNRQ